MKPPTIAFNLDTIRAQLYDDIAGALRLGWNRAHKHLDQPSEDVIHTEQLQAVELVLDEWLDWPEPE